MVLNSNGKKEEKKKYGPQGDCFTVKKNGKIKDPAGWGYNYTQKEFDNINFMTPEKLYQSDPIFCKKLYWKVSNTLKSGDCCDWYIKMCRFYKSTLETIPELRYIVDAEKYNL